MTKHKPLIFKLALIFGGFFLLQLFLGTLTLYGVYMNQANRYVEQTTKRIQDDISFENGSWNLSRYNADPNVPDTFPIYILSSDGYVIDRWKPIHGFLDTSDIKHLTMYTSPQTVKTPAEQTWRVYSQPIEQNNQILGLITTGSYIQNTLSGDDLDQKITQAAKTISEKLKIQNNTIDASHIDMRDINFDISFQVVDKFNKVIAKNNNTNSIDRLPNYLDLSYVGDLLSTPRLQQIRDTQTQEPFLFLTTPLVHDNTVMGVLVVGRSIASLSELMGKFLIIEFIFGTLLSIGGIFTSFAITQPYLATVNDEDIFHETEKISFNKKESMLVLDDTEIAIPFATNQYYLCESLFSNPKKRFETDELLEKFGETDFTNARKVYDAMITVNKKVEPFLHAKLIIARDKTYQINPSIASKID